MADLLTTLDAWVAQQGNGQYESRTFVPLQGWQIPDDAGIQQDRQELADFLTVLTNSPPHDRVLEIGLGYYGSTHFLWRQLFTHVITIEKSHERIRTFGTNLRAFSGRWVLDDKRSAFLIGMSHDPSIVQKAYACAQGGVDLLFIDGDHAYASVLSDWLLYSPLVRPGGLIAFHDVALTTEPSYGVHRVVQQLADGTLDGKERTMQRIVYTPNMGLAYYRQ